MGLLSWLLRRKAADGPLPKSMTDLRKNDPCWCGSGNKYKYCHRREDQRRLAELGGKKAASNPFV